MYSLLYLFVTPRTMEIGKPPHGRRGQYNSSSRLVVVAPV